MVRIIRRNRMLRVCLQLVVGYPTGQGCRVVAAAITLFFPTFKTARAAPALPSRPRAFELGSNSSGQREIWFSKRNQ